ncbi:unnamed protein product, partial [Onchocerca flexuosa]|uniref:Uncharacterized protein n=1 Tax=Onchocerca flexuosa TaxID=387005 RepID=A0A183HUZ3_9BILA
TELFPLSGPFRIVDIRFTAPPLNHLELTTSGLPQKTRKQSILLNKGIRKFKNGQKIFSEDSAETEINDRRNANLLGSKAMEFWRENFQRSKNIGYQIDQPERFSGSENQRYEQEDKLVKSSKGAKPIFSLHQIEGDSNDSDLMANLKPDYPGMLTPKPIISPHSIQFVNGINEHMKYDNQQQTGYPNLNPEILCPPGTTIITNQPWNPLSSAAQSGKIWTPEYQLPMMMNRFPASTLQYQPNYQPTAWDTVFQGPAGQFVPPIIPINNQFDDSVQMNLSNRSNSLMSNRATTINRSGHMLDGSKIPVHPIYTGYTESWPSDIPLSNVPSISQTNSAFKKVNFYNRLPMLPTMTAMKSTYQKIGTE